MSFFNLTHTGVQDPFKTAASCSKEEKTISTTAPADERNNQTQVTTSSSSLTPTHVQTMYSTTESGRSSTGWHRGSHCQYTELLRKHQRHPHGPMELYQHPLTTSNEYGWWLKDGAPHREEWAQSERHAHVNSEMTRFVDDMSLTNKEFSLY